MAVTASRVSIGTSATSIATGPESVAGAKGTDLLVRVPSGGVTVTLGPSGVTTANGFDLGAGESISINLDPTETLYGIVASGTQTVHILGSSDDD